MKDKVLLGHIAVFIAMVIYGANYAISKEVTPEFVKPFGLVVYRAIGALALFWIVSLIWVRERMHKADILKCAGLAVVGVAINQMLFVKGLSMTLPINAAIMMITSPILVVVLGFILGKEKASWLRIAGILIGFVGAFLFITSGGPAIGKYKADSWGDIFILINALSWGTYLIYARPMMARYHTITIMKWTFLFGLIYVFPFGYSEFVEVEWKDFNGQIWFDLLYIIFGTTFFAYLLNTYALKSLSSSVVSAYIYLQPFLAALFGVLWGMDQLSLEKVLYSCIVFVGVYLTGRG